MLVSCKLRRKALSRLVCVEGWINYMAVIFENTFFFGMLVKEGTFSAGVT